MTSPIPQPIRELPSQQSALVGRLRTWAEINSGSDHLAGLARMGKVLVTALQALTPDVQCIRLAEDGRFAVHARVRPEAKLRVLCSGHYDTVYGEGSSFQRCGDESGGRLNGPGVADMKGGIVVMLAALHAFEQTTDAANLGYDVLLTPDEEIGSAASRPYLEQLAPAFRLGMIFEPARENGELIRTRKGTGVFRVTCHGRSAHAGRDPAAGRNAILALAELLLELQARVAGEAGLLLNVGRIEGGGSVNVVPDLAWAELNARATTPADADTFSALLESAAAKIESREGFRVERSGQFNRPPTECRPVHEALFAAFAQGAHDLRIAPLRWVHVGGGSDGNLLEAVGLPCLDGLGPIGGHLHSPGEYVEVESLPQRAQLNALFLGRLAAGEIPF